MLNRSQIEQLFWIHTVALSKVKNENKHRRRFRGYMKQIRFSCGCKNQQNQALSKKTKTQNKQ